MRARYQRLAIEAFMIALAAHAPPAIIECREHKPASAREDPQFRIAVRPRSATWARAVGRSGCETPGWLSAGCLASKGGGSRLRPRQNFPLTLPHNRHLCSTVGGRIVEGWTAHCCVVSAARSRAATMTNLARSSLALVLPALFG